MFNVSYNQTWALFAVYYFLSLCAGSQAMAQSRKIGSHTAPVVKVAATRAKGVAQMARGTAVSKALNVPTGLTPTGSQTATNFQYPQVYGPRPYSPAGMGNGGIQPTYVNPGAANGMNQPIPETGNSLMQNLLIFGGLAALAAGVVMKMSASDKRVPPPESLRTTSGGSDYDTTADDSSSSDPNPRQTRVPALPRTVSESGEAERPSTASTANRPAPVGPGIADDEPMVTASRPDASSADAAREVSDRTPQPTAEPLRATAEPVRADAATRTETPFAGMIVQHGDAQTRAADRPEQRVQTENSPTADQRPPKSETRETPPARRAVADKPKPETRAPASRPRGQRICASNVQQVQTSGLQDYLNPLINRNRIQSGAKFEWVHDGAPFILQAQGNAMVGHYSGYNLRIDRICSNGRSTHIDVTVTSEGLGNGAKRTLQILRQHGRTVAKIAGEGEYKPLRPPRVSGTVQIPLPTSVATVPAAPAGRE